MKQLNDSLQKLKVTNPDQYRVLMKQKNQMESIHQKEEKNKFTLQERLKQKLSEQKSSRCSSHSKAFSEVKREEWYKKKEENEEKQKKKKRIHNKLKKKRYKKNKMIQKENVNIEKQFIHIKDNVFIQDINE